MRGFEAEVCHKLGCKYVDAKEMIDEAKASLEIDNENDHKEKVMAKVEELWESRKPANAEASGVAKMNEERQQLQDQHDEVQAKRKKDDEEFRNCVVCCCTLGLSKWWQKDTSPFRSNAKD